jgi:hypothetical protein
MGYYWVHTKQINRKEACLGLQIMEPGKAVYTTVRGSSLHRDLIQTPRYKLWSACMTDLLRGGDNGRLAENGSRRSGMQ